MGFASARASRYGIRECSGGYSCTNAGAGAGHITVHSDDPARPTLLINLDVKLSAPTLLVEVDGPSCKPFASSLAFVPGLPHVLC